MKKQDLHIFNGMDKDFAVSRHKVESLYDARNLRFTARDGDTLLAITNEKGTTEMSLSQAVQGTYLGHCVINDYVVVFTHTNTYDYIYKVTPTAYNSANVFELYHGVLNFNNLIETLGVYENENVQKVYWVDGENQPRVLNVCRLEEDVNLRTGNETQFDFVQDLHLTETVSINKAHGDGMFAPGVIQYAFSYYNLYLQQTNIFYTTPIQYISFLDRAGSPEDRVSNIFRITIANVDTRFDYVRIYSIHRTSLDAVPTVKRVADIEIKGRVNISYTDSGTVGDIVDPMELLYIGGDLYSVETITSKDNTLFLGNYSSMRKTPIDITTSFENDIEATTSFRIDKSVDKKINTSGFYYYATSLDSPIHGFKNREHYRLGFQLQHKSGKWSPPYFLEDWTVNSSTNPDLFIDENGITYTSIGIDVELDLSNYLDDIIDNGYTKIRPVCVFPKPNERLVLTQGLLCPTVFGVNNRVKNAPYAQSSWFFRLNASKDISEYLAGDFYGDWIEFRHLHTLRPDNTFGAEIMGCGNLINKFLTDGDYKLRLVGISNFVSTYYDVDIEATTPPNTTNAFKQARGGIINSDNAIKGLATGGFWEDNIIIGTSDGDTYKEISYAGTTRNFAVYPWHSMGSLNNDTNRPLEEGVRTSELKTKKLGNLRFSKNNTWFSEDIINSNVCIYDITNYKIFNSDQKTILNLTPQDSSISDTAEKVYYGNEDYMFSKILPRTSEGAKKVVKTTLGELEELAYTNSTIDTSRVIRMQYKSPKHIVFGLKNNSNSHRPIILPSINNLNRADPVVVYVPEWYKGYGASGDTASYIQILERILTLYNGKTFQQWIGENRQVLDSDPTRYNKTLWLIFNGAETEGTIYLLLYSESIDQATNDTVYEWYCISDLSIYQNFIARYYSYGEGNDIHYYRRTNTGTINIRATLDETFVPSYEGNGVLDVADYRVIQRNIDLETLSYPYMFIGELYREPDATIDFLNVLGTPFLFQSFLIDKTQTRDEYR